MGQSGLDMIDYFTKTLADRFPDAEFLAPQGFERYTPQRTMGAGDDMPNMPGTGGDSKELPRLRQWFSLAVNPPPALIRKSPGLSRIFNRGILWLRMMGAEEKLNRYIDKALHERGLDERQLVILGFSQGGSLALYTGLRRSKPPAAVISHSGLFHGGIPPSSLPETLLIHGTKDKIISVTAADRALELLLKKKVPARLEKIEGLGHRTNERALAACASFIHEKLAMAQSLTPTRARRKGRWIRPALRFKKLFLL